MKGFHMEPGTDKEAATRYPPSFLAVELREWDLPCCWFFCCSVPQKRCSKLAAVECSATTPNLLEKLRDGMGSFPRSTLPITYRRSHMQMQKTMLAQTDRDNKGSAPSITVLVQLRKREPLPTFGWKHRAPCRLQPCHSESPIGSQPGETKAK